MSAYYNEIDPYAAQWLRNLIAAGHIADGVVDTRSIEDVHPADLQDFTQCHFFAGVGVWSLALRRAGWSDDRPVWTGSCPCQPFSAAGQGAGFADERHLWPAFGHLIAQCKPAVVLGEQVASKDVDVWIDLVHADLETLGYAFGSVPFPSAGVGAPHIRDRNYWVANTSGARSLPGALAGIHRGESGAGARNGEPKRPRAAGGLAHANGRDASAERQQRGGEQRQQPEDGGARGLADADNQRCAGQRLLLRPEEGGAGESSLLEVAGSSEALRPGPTNGFWRDADWLGCTDGKWRPVEPRPQSLVDGSAESLGRVRPDAIEEIEKEINATTAQSEGGRTAAMRDLLIHLGAEAQRGWPSGRLPGLHEAPFLLSFLRQLQEQGCRIAEGVALPRPEAAQAYLRMLRDNAAPSGASREHGLAGQQPSERANAVHFLSSLLARHAHSAWDHAYSTYAEIGFPLAHGARSRVGRLKGYGNAINAEAARVWVETVMESTC